jgi:hypothetical protein
LASRTRLIRLERFIRNGQNGKKAAKFIHTIGKLEDECLTLVAGEHCRNLGSVLAFLGQGLWEFFLYKALDSNDVLSKRFNLCISANEKPTKRSQLTDTIMSFLLSTKSSKNVEN